ncbi:DUF4169 family protein [Novosphingobium sp. 9]|uniref:DUF4169 family protein n=1 Tax=Novosphingobium sp. 9 TaxID=2025349 RepID=UPI0021B5AA88|nr:DUF4169 family protein [Novosphingobium sp. 9]
MAEIVNLRMARKAKARATASVQADTARAQHGRSKAEKTATRAEVLRVGKALDGAKREKEQD